MSIQEKFERKIGGMIDMQPGNFLKLSSSPSRVLSELWVKGCGKQLLGLHSHYDRLLTLRLGLLLWRKPACTSQKIDIAAGLYRRSTE